MRVVCVPMPVSFCGGVPEQRLGGIAGRWLGYGYEVRDVSFLPFRPCVNQIDGWGNGGCAVECDAAAMPCLRFALAAAVLASAIQGLVDLQEASNLAATEPM